MLVGLQTLPTELLVTAQRRECGSARSSWRRPRAGWPTSGSSRVGSLPAGVTILPPLQSSRLGFATIGDARSEMDRPPRPSAPPTPMVPITSSPSLIVNAPAPNDHVLRGLKPLVTI